MAEVGSEPGRLARAYRHLYAWAAERLYHELAWAYDAVAWCVSLGHWDGWRSQVLDHIASDARVLEVGFGTGALLVKANARGLDAWGADPSSAMQRVARRRLRRHRLGVRCVRAPAQALPFADGTFDAILATFPTRYILDPAALCEMGRLVRVGREGVHVGRIVITGVGFRVGAMAGRGGLQRLLSLIFGGGDVDIVTRYADYAAAHGFAVTVVDEDGEGVRVPVVILEWSSSEATT